MMDMPQVSTIWAYNMRVMTQTSTGFSVEATVHSSTNIASLGLHYLAIDSTLNHINVLNNQDFKVLNGGSSNC